MAKPTPEPCVCGHKEVQHAVQGRCLACLDCSGYTESVTSHDDEITNKITVSLLKTLVDEIAELWDKVEALEAVLVHSADDPAVKPEAIAEYEANIEAQTETAVELAQYSRELEDTVETLNATLDWISREADSTEGRLVFTRELLGKAENAMAAAQEGDLSLIEDYWREMNVSLMSISPGPRDTVTTNEPATSWQRLITFGEEPE